MCILFVYAVENPQPNEYKLILAVNRDEYYKRPTKEASFWGTSPNIVGGRDMEPGREGGTWLAMSETGRIGALLNVLQTKAEYATAAERKGRGPLVNNFLKSTTSAMEYLNGIYQVASDYNPFTLVTVDVNKVTPEVCYYSCAKDRKPVTLPPGIVHGVGNCFIDTPFMKVRTGTEAISKIVKECNYVEKKDTLIDELLGVLKNNTNYHPDKQMLAIIPDQSESFMRGLSSRFIAMPGYGTRTHTIILVDYNNRVFYKELTLTEPISDNNRNWTESNFEFNIVED